MGHRVEHPRRTVNVVCRMLPTGLPENRFRKRTFSLHFSLEELAVLQHFLLEKKFA